jgi:hypothetical protein
MNFMGFALLVVSTAVEWPFQKVVDWDFPISTSPSTFFVQFSDPFFEEPPLRLQPRERQGT